MKIEIQDDRAPAHWRSLQPIVDGDPQLRPEVRLVIRPGERIFLDDAGARLPIELPATFTEPALAERSTQLSFVVWLWWTFARPEAWPPGGGAKSKNAAPLNG